MKNKFKKKMGVLSILGMILMLVVSSCDIANIEEPVTVDKIDKLSFEIFEPSRNVIIEDNMIVFETKDDLETILNEIRMADRRAVDAWEESLSFTSQQNIFNKIVVEEEKILEYYDNLTPQEQDYFKTMPEVTSSIYDEYLEKGLIKIEKDPNDGSEYYNYSMIDPSMASVTNLNGFVKIEGRIYWFTSDAVKIIIDGDLNKVNTINEINEDFYDDNFIVFFKKKASLSGSKQYLSSNEYSFSRSWYYFSNREKGAVWVDGHSETLYVNGDVCANYLNCTFVLRAEVLKKNIWGNWKHKTWKSLSFSATWDYEHSVPDYYGSCSLYCTDYSNSLPSSKPASPYSYYSGSVNDAYISLAPHGQWYSASAFCGAVDVINYSISANLGGRTFNLSH